MAGDPDVLTDVRTAVTEIQQKGFGKGHPGAIELLFPTGTTARADIEGLAALRSQLPELARELKPPSPDDIKAGQVQPVDPLKVASSVADVLTSREKQRELLEEVRNAFRSTPKGLETPEYEVVRSWRVGEGALDGEVELRSYEPFTVARKTTGVGEDGFNSLEGSGEGFNSLAGYLFGGNAEEKSMAMTMPVQMDSTSGNSSMAFVIPKQDAESPPTPNSADVTIENVPARLVAVKAFGGIVTEEEVERQKKKLIEAIGVDGSTRPVDSGAFSVLQYNAPYTIPWRRRNEIAIVVEDLTPPEAMAAPEDVQPPEAEEDSKDEVVSWYDSGIRL